MRPSSTCTSGTTPDRVAEKTIRAIYRNQPIALVGVAAYVLYYCKRFAPGIFYAMHGIGRAKNLRNKLKKLYAAPHRDGEAIAAGRHEPRAEPTTVNNRAA